MIRTSAYFLPIIWRFLHRTMVSRWNEFLISPTPYLYCIQDDNTNKIDSSYERFYWRRELTLRVSSRLQWMERTWPCLQVWTASALWLLSSSLCQGPSDE
jgi:hypothetical protein